MSNSSSPSQSLLSVTFRLPKLLVFVCIPTFNPDSRHQAHSSKSITFKREDQLNRALATPLTWTRLPAFPFQKLWSRKEPYISLSFLIAIVQQPLDCFSKLGFLQSLEQQNPAFGLLTTCYGLLTLGRSYTTSRSTVAASTTASTRPQCGLPLLPNRKVNQYQSCMHQCPLSY